MKEKILSLLHKCRYGVFAVLGLLAAPAFAEGEQQGAFDTALTNLQTGVTGMIDKVVPVVAAILVALLVFVGLFMAWRYVKKAAK